MSHKALFASVPSPAQSLQRFLGSGDTSGYSGDFLRSFWGDLDKLPSGTDVGKELDLIKL